MLMKVQFLMGLLPHWHMTLHLYCCSRRSIPAISLIDLQICIGSQTHVPKDTILCRAWSNPWIIEHQIQYAVKQRCVRLRNAVKCTSEAVFTVIESRIAD